MALKIHHFYFRERDWLKAQLLPFWIHQYVYWGHTSCGLLIPNDWAQWGHWWRPFFFFAQCCILLTDGHAWGHPISLAKLFRLFRIFLDYQSLTLILSNPLSFSLYFKCLKSASRFEGSPTFLSSFPLSFIGIPHYKCAAHLISFWKTQIITEEIMSYSSLFFQHFRKCQVGIEVISNPFYT